MLDNETKKKIDDCRNILVGKLPDPKAQIEQITIALIYKFMDDMDKESIDLGGTAKFFSGDYKKYSWDSLFDPKVTANEMLSLYSEAIVSMEKNPNIPLLFRNIFKNAYLPYRDPETLKLFLKTIAGFEYTHSEKLGDAFEYLLSIMGSQGDAGQFRTPRHIIDFLVKSVDPEKSDTILDPACGTAGFLISAFKHIQSKSDHQLTPDERKRLIKNLIGYDISPDMVRLSLVNLYLHGFSDPHIFEYDTLTSEDRWNDSFDVILANPPFMTPKGGIRPHKRFSVQANRSEVLFVDYIAEHLSTNGRAGIIVPEGIIFQSATAYKALRKYLVENNYLWAVISLPAGVFNPYSGVKTSILLLDKVRAKQTDEVLFIKIANDGYDLGAQRREIDKNDLAEALEILTDWKQGLKKESSLALWVNQSKLAEDADYNLSLDRYRLAEVRTNQKWPVVPLGEVCKVISGQSPEGEFYNENGIGTPFYQGKTEFGNVYIGSPVKWTTQETKIAEANDILMSVRAPVGPVNVATQRICIGRGLAAIRPNDQVLLGYLFNFLKNIEKDIKGNGGAVFDSINRKDIEALKIPLPPLDVQQEIVAEIEGYQKIIDGARQVVDNWKPQIEIDPEWPMVKLGEACEVRSGGTPSRTIKEYWDGRISWYSSGELNVLYTTDPKEKITDQGLKNSNATLFPKGSLLIGMYDTAAFKMSILDRDATFNQAICGVKPTENIDLVFLYLYFQMKRDYYLNHRLGVRQRNLSKGYIEDIDIPLPTLSIQHEIVAKIQEERTVVDGCEKLISIYESKIKKVIDKVWGE